MLRGQIDAVVQVLFEESDLEGPQSRWLERELEYRDYNWMHADALRDLAKHGSWGLKLESLHSTVNALQRDNFKSPMTREQLLNRDPETERMLDELADGSSRASAYDAPFCLCFGKTSLSGKRVCFRRPLHRSRQMNISAFSEPSSPCLLAS